MPASEPLCSDMPTLNLNFVGARKESYSPDSRKPAVENGTLQDDQNRRDFTINALAISINTPNFGTLIDPFGGVEHLQQGIIVTPLEPEKTFSDDPLRMMRAIRFATQLQFQLAPQTCQAIQDYANRITIISKERIIAELNKILASPIPSIGFKLLFDTGLLHIIFPEMAKLYGVDVRDGKGHKDNFYHTLQVVDNLCRTTDNIWLRWAAVLHDIAKPPTKRYEPAHGWTFHGHEDLGARMVPGIFKRLSLPLGHEMKYVQKLVLLHLRPISLTKENITDSAIRRLLFEAGDDIDDLMLLCKADITTKSTRKLQKYLEDYDMVSQKLKEIEEKDKLRNWQPPVSGDDIMRVFGLKPSREVGIIKNALREAILEGDIPNSTEEARQFVLQIGTNLGLVPVQSF
jgi:poly(A) polymerase